VPTRETRPNIASVVSFLRWEAALAAAVTPAADKHFSDGTQSNSGSKIANPKAAGWFCFQLCLLNKQYACYLGIMAWR
jgi:hypothetical protein